MAPHVARAVEATRNVAQPKTLAPALHPALQGKMAPHVARVVQAVQRPAGASLPSPVQLRRAAPSPTAQLRAPSVAQRANVSSEVISGHGRFNENYLETDKRKKKPKFPVPAGVALTLYAPDGAALENAVANLVEQGKPAPASDVELAENDGRRTQPVPAPYPYRYTTDEEVVNYTVMPADKLNVAGKPYTVDKPTALKEVVETLAARGVTEIHYACCGAGYSDTFRELFPYRGWYVRLK